MASKHDDQPRDALATPAAPASADTASNDNAPGGDGAAVHVPGGPAIVRDVGSDERDDGPAPATSVGLWGPTGHGKTNLAATLVVDPGYAPAVYVDSDGGLPAIRGYEEADLIVHRPVKTFADVVRVIRDVESGRVKNRAGQRVRSFVLDAVTKLIPAELERMGLVTREAKDQAQLLAQPWKAFLGQLTALHREHGITSVHVAHSKDTSAKVGDVVHDFIKPDLFKSLANPWMSSLRHLWRITKTTSKKGPAFPIMMLRTEPEGVYGTATHVPWMKTSSIAFSQWIFSQSGGRQHYQWDTSTMPQEDWPTLAWFLRVCDDLALEQGKVAVKNPAALRAMAALTAAMDAAADSGTEAA